MSSENKTSKSWRDYLENILIVLLVALLIRTFVFGTPSKKQKELLAKESKPASRNKIGFKHYD